MSKPSNMQSLIAQMVANGLLPESAARSAQELAEKVSNDSATIYEVLKDGFSVVIEPAGEGKEVDNNAYFAGYAAAKAHSLKYLKDNLTGYRQAFKDLRSLKKAEVDASVETIDTPAVG